MTVVALKPRQYSFTDHAVSNPVAPPPGDKLDGEVDRIDKSISQIIDWVSVSLNSDGTLKAAPVTTSAPQTMSTGVLGPQAGTHLFAGADPNAQAQDWSEVSFEWAEHMPDTIPPNILATMGITGDHWSARWWAHRALEIAAEVGAVAGGVDVYVGELAPPSPATGKLWWCTSDAQLYVFYDDFTSSQWVVANNPLLSTSQLNVLDYGADPTGASNSAPAFQAAINAAAGTGKVIIVPAGRYRIDTTLDCHNLEYLVLRGDGAEAPAFGLALVAPTKGTVIVGNTAGAIMDFVGSNNILIRDIAFTALGAATPSIVGLIFGTSTRTGGTTGAPGGANICLENVVVQLTSAAGSLPIYFNPGSGLSHFINVWTLGQYGIAATATNPLAITPPYGTFGPVTDVDGLILSGCSLLGYGGGQPLYLEAANDFTAEQTYIATIAGGAGYAGQPYAVYMKNMTDAKLKLEVDYFPSVLYSTGSLLNVWIEGIIFQNLTPVPAGVPFIAKFDGTTVDNVQINVRPIHGLFAGSPYHYQVANTVTLFRNISLGYFLTAVSPNVLNGNLAAGGAYINTVLRGDSDTPNNVFNINGILAAYPSLRYSINGFSSRQVINSNPVALPNPPGGTVLQAGNANAGQTRIVADSFGGFASCSLRRANNTNASPTALASGDIIGSVDWFGYGTAYSSAQASIRCLANEAWTGSGNGTILTFNTTPNTTTTLTERMRLYDDGGLVIAAPAGLSKGAGTLNAVGVYAAGVLLTSDANLKTDIEPLPEALPMVAAIEPKSFRWKEPAEAPVDADGNPIPLGPPGHFEQINRGFLAQDVAAVIGGKDDAVDLGAMVAVLWQAVREMSDKIALLEAKP